MKPSTIIPVRSSDSWISIGMKDGPNAFASRDGGCAASTVTLSITRTDCVAPPVRTCTTDTCGNRVWRVTPAPVTPPVVIYSEGTDTTGRHRFILTPAFAALGKGRMNGVLSACGKTVPVMLQVFSQPVLVSYDKGEYTCTKNFMGLGDMAIFPDGCSIPPGWAAVEALDGGVAGYGRTTVCGAFNKPVRQLDGSTVYLE